MAVLLAPTASIARHDDHSTAGTPSRRSAVACEKMCLRIFGADGDKA